MIRDLKKLDEIDKLKKWVIAFVYPAPNPKDWDNHIASLTDALKH